MLKILCIIAVFVLSACAGIGQPGEKVSTDVAGAVSYIHDDKHNVGCWFYNGASGGSISCLPDSSYLP